MLGDLPPPEDLTPRLQTIIRQTDFVALARKNVELGFLAILVASQQVINLGDEEIRQHVKSELVKVAKLLAGSDLIEVIVRSVEGADFNESQVMFFRLFETALNLSIAVQASPEEVIIEFRDIMTPLAEVWPAMTPATLKPIIQRLCEELPVSQAQHLWPLLVRFRAQ